MELVGHSKWGVEFRTAEVPGICVRKEGAQKMCLKHPFATKVEKQQLLGACKLRGDSGDLPELRGTRLWGLS